MYKHVSQPLADTSLRLHTFSNRNCIDYETHHCLHSGCAISEGGLQIHQMHMVVCQHLFLIVYEKQKDFMLFCKLFLISLQKHWLGPLEMCQCWFLLNYVLSGSGHSNHGGHKVFATRKYIQNWLLVNHIPLNKAVINQPNHFMDANLCECT